MIASLLTPLQSAAEIATDDRFSQMLRFFGIAVVLVVPACVVVWRRAAKKAGASLREIEIVEEEPELPPDPFELSTVIAAIDAAARALGPNDSATIDVPAALTLDGTSAPDALAHNLINDAIVRNRVTATWSVREDGWRTVTLSR